MKKEKKLVVLFWILILFVCVLGFFFNIKINDLQFEIKNLSSTIESQKNEITELKSNLGKTQNTTNIAESNNNVELSSNNTSKTIFDNSSTDGLNPISKNEAKEIWENYRKQYVVNNYSDYVIKDIKIEDVYPNNHLTSYTQEAVADFTRKAYVFYCDFDDNLSHITGYVDMYTGKVIGGYCSGV